MDVVVGKRYWNRRHRSWGEVVEVIDGMWCKMRYEGAGSIVNYAEIADLDEEVR